MSDQPPPSDVGYILPTKVYDGLKAAVQVLLPGAGALYFALAQIWGLPKAEEVVGSISAVAVFLGLLLGLSSRNYYKDERGRVDFVYALLVAILLIFAVYPERTLL